MRQRTNSRTSRRVPADAAMAPQDMTATLPIEEALALELLASGEEACEELRQIMQRELQDLHDIKSKLLEQVFTTRKSTKRKLNSIHEDNENMPKKRQSLENAMHNDQKPAERQTQLSEENSIIEPLKPIDNIIMPPPVLPIKTKSKRATTKAAQDVETTVIRKSRRIKTIAESTEEINTTVTRITRSSVRCNSSKIVANKDEQDETIKTTTKKTRGKNKNTKASDVTIKKEKSVDDIGTDEEVTKDDTVTNVDTIKVEVPEVSATDSTIVVGTKEDILMNDVEMVEVDAHITINDSQNTIIEEVPNDIKNKPNNKLTIVFDNNINENSMLNLENNGNTSTPDKMGSDKDVQVDEIIVVEKKVDKAEEKKTLDATVILEKSPTENSKKVALDETIVIASNKANLAPSSDNHDGSVLSEDMSEVEETPPKLVIQNPKVIPMNKDTIKLFESPVKSCVKHFEKLAEIANAKSMQAQNERKNTRSRNITKKNSKVDIKVAIEAEKPKTIVKNTPNNLKKNVTKCNLPLPSKQVTSATKYSSTSSVNKLLSPKPVSSSQTVAQAAAAKIEREAAIKRDAYNKKMEELKKRREEDARNLELKLKESARLQVEKTKAAQERRLKEEELKKQKEARRQGENSEKALKKAAKENDLVQKVKKMDQAANKTYELNSTTVLNSHNRVSNFITQPNQAFDEMMKCDEDLEEQNASDKERKKVIELRKPQWAKKTNLNYIMGYQKHIKIHVRDTLYSTAIFSPDLSEIFPNIDRSKLKRTSSAVWKTPPRCSMMPR